MGKRSTGLAGSPGGAPGLGGPGSAPQQAVQAGGCRAGPAAQRLKGAGRWHPALGGPSRGAGRVAEPLCLGFPTCGNKYLPVKPWQLLAC